MIEIEQTVWTAERGWGGREPGSCARAQWVLVFGATSILGTEHALDDIQAAYPRANLVGCSTSGEICGTHVLDESLVVTAVRFEHTAVRVAHVQLTGEMDSLRAGRALAQALRREDLCHVFVLSDGLQINGSSLVAGMMEQLPSGVVVTGGLAGDGARFQQTLVLADGTVGSGQIAAVGFYGKRLRVGYGSQGGWDSFGPERVITRSAGNVLYELDGQSALALYERYLGEYAKGLPATALRFPLCLRSAEGDSLVRTVLNVDRESQSLTFAGDMPQGTRARFMKANFERLIDGAIDAAASGWPRESTAPPDLAILVSCVGRKLVLKQRVEEEVEGVHRALGGQGVLTGFYSYGEIAPSLPSGACELHNQTMTITTFAEE